MSPTESSEFPISWDLLDRYYAGEGTPEERAKIEAYLATHTPSSHVVTQVAAELREVSASKDASHAPKVSSMLASLHDRMQPHTALKRLVQTCFGGSVERAVAALLDVDDTKLTPAEIDRLRRAIVDATEKEQ